MNSNLNFAQLRTHGTYARTQLSESKSEGDENIMKIKLPMITEEVCNSARRVWDKKRVRA